VRNRARAERDVHVRVELEDPFPLRLRVTPADRDHLVRIARLERAGLSEMRREALIGLLPHGARVEDDDVGFVLRTRLTEPERLQHAFDALRVVSIHLAAERRDEVSPHASTVPVSSTALDHAAERAAVTASFGLKH
jgi:hypothetical protein